MGYDTHEDMVNALENAITPGPFILGDRYGAADIYIGSQIRFGIMTRILEPRPSFQAYLALISERPAYTRMLEQSEQYTAKLKAAG
jgi:glutathione S-transferase